MKSQHTDNSVSRLNATFRRLAEALERHNAERENERLAALVQDALNERAT